MFIKKILPLLFLLITASVLNAQELFFCESYAEDGTPVGPLNRLEIKPYGTGIYILIQNDKTFDDPILYLFIDKFNGTKFTPFDSKTISLKNDDTWAVTSFEFKEQGIYEAYFLNSSQSRLATGKIETYFAGEFINQIASPSLNTFGNRDFVFCEMVINHKPVNAFSSLSKSSSGGQAFIYINNHVPFGIEKIKVQYWKRSKERDGYEELIDSKQYRILPEWKDTFFKYIFTQTGEFKIDIYDHNDNFISSNVITVTE